MYVPIKITSRNLEKEHLIIIIQAGIVFIGIRANADSVYIQNQ